jgi:hypothetical protein
VLGAVPCLIWFDQIIVFGSVIQVPDVDVCGAHGRASAHLVHGPIFEDLSAFMLEHGSRMKILLA